MKIIIYAIITTAPEGRQALLNSLKNLIASVLEQPGCVRYDWAADSCDDTHINVYEEWDSEAALDSHFAGENFTTMGKALQAHGILGASARKFRIDKEASVFNDLGVATSLFD